MSTQGLIWLEALKSRLGRRNPGWLMLRQLWFTLTEIPLMLAARKELAQALDAEFHKQAALQQKLEEQPKVEHIL